jgi:hypothetical protein
LYAFADGSLMGEAERSSRAARLLKMSGAAISAKSNKTTTKHHVPIAPVPNITMGEA